jgi:hypothetical protein
MALLFSANATGGIVLLTDICATNNVFSGGGGRTSESEYRVLENDLYVHKGRSRPFGML